MVVFRSMPMIGTLLEEAGHSWIGESVRDFYAHGEVWHGLDENDEQMNYDTLR
jgi:hypothetical protein